MNYARNAWYVADWVDNVESEKPLAVQILGDRIVVFRNKNNELVALEDRCVHRLAPLSLGRCENGNLRCMYHGFLYDGDGEVIEIPGQKQIPAKAKIKSYPVVAKHSWVWIWMGKPELADENLIPDAIGRDNPDYILGHGDLDYDAEAYLICDNLLDFSHLTYVHANSFGATSDFADNPPKITALERGVRFERWVENNVSGTLAKQLGVKSDSWMRTDFIVPGILLMETASFETGTAKSVNYGRPDMEKALGGVTFTSQAVTPVSRNKSRYFFMWGPHVKHGNEAMRDGMMNVALQAFSEDKEMIEAQQIIIDGLDKPDIMASVHDRGVILYSRLVEKLSSEN